ncbi:MAG: thiamine diphosphokinase [Culicoidibacterales bacterium]
MKVMLVAYTNWLPNLDAYDYVIAVDSGIRQFAKAQRSCDYWIGDFDSIDAIEPYQRFTKVTKQLPKMKDETDTHAALLFAIEQLQATEVTIITTHSGRFDHQYAQMLLCQFGIKNGVQVKIQSQTAEIELLTPGSYRFEANDYPYFSIFAWQQQVGDLTFKHVIYPLEHVTVAPDSPLGISNELVGPWAQLEFGSGLLLVIRSRDE